MRAARLPSPPAQPAPPAQPTPPVSRRAFVTHPPRRALFNRVFDHQPIEADNWVVEFEFRVDGQGTKVFGDGFAFWMTQERAQPGVWRAHAVTASACRTADRAEVGEHARGRPGVREQGQLPGPRRLLRHVHERQAHGTSEGRPAAGASSVQSPLTAGPGTRRPATCRTRGRR